ncbi:MAG TPA: SRPBCC family protein [Gemmataceae bacterium]|nr:SRPBCC family protein [Gemmataceae bacterium]
MASTVLAVAAKSATNERSTARKMINALPHIDTNVSAPERAGSLAIGAALVGYGMSQKQPSLWALLGGAYLVYRGMTGNCPISQAVKFSTSDSTAPGTAVAGRHGTRVEHAVTINKPVADVYRFWRDFANLPHFMMHLIDVDTTSDGKSHWIARGPMGMKVEWDAEIITDTPNSLIAWRSLRGSDVDSAGSVHFRDRGPGLGTEVRVELKYDPPAGKFGTMIAKLFGENPDRQVREDLRRLKQILEAGQVPTTKGQAHGKR